MYQTNKHYVVILTLPVLTFLASIFVGKYPLEFHIASPLTSLSTMLSSHVIFNVRLPRIALAALAGASLQSCLRNPLASPYILGITQGAAFGASLAMLLLPTLPYATAGFAFVFGMAAISLTIMFAKIRGVFSTVTMILAGVIVGAIFSALVSTLQWIADPYALRGIVFWMLGGFYKASWEYLFIALAGALPALTLLVLVRWRLNVLSMGDEEATMLGVNVNFERLLVVLLSALVCASVTSVSGIVAWIGLIIPHMVRGLVGSDNRYLIPGSIALGAALLMLTDNFCRSLFTFEIPISIVTTLITAPYFIYLLRKVVVNGANS